MCSFSAISSSRAAEETMRQNDAVNTRFLARRLNDNRYTYSVDTLGKPVPAAPDLWHPGHIVWDAVSLVPIQSAKSGDERGVGSMLSSVEGYTTRERGREREERINSETWQWIGVDRLAFPRRKKCKPEDGEDGKPGNFKWEVIPVPGIDPSFPMGKILSNYSHSVGGGIGDSCGVWKTTYGRKNVATLEFSSCDLQLDLLSVVRKFFLFFFVRNC